MFFNKEEVESAISNTRFAARLTHLTLAISTNQSALEAANEGATSGVWVADEQTAGRGRGGHAWHSAPGDGLYVTALATPQLPLSSATSLPIAAGLAMQAAVREVTGLELDIRWPNDLMFADLKCGGILVESASAPSPAEWLARHPSALKYAVIGVGLNLNHSAFPSELARLATSLYLESGRHFERELILAAFLNNLDAEITLLETDFRSPGTDPTLAARLTAASTWVSGKRVLVGVDEQGRGGYTGITRGLDSAGFLLVQADDGNTHTVLSGGVRSA